MTSVQIARLDMFSLILIVTTLVILNLGLLLTVIGQLVAIRREHRAIMDTFNITTEDDEREEVVYRRAID